MDNPEIDPFKILEETLGIPVVLDIIEVATRAQSRGDTGATFSTGEEGTEELVVTVDGPYFSFRTQEHGGFLLTVSEVLERFSEGTEQIPE